MSLRITGMSSGLDIEGMIDQIMSASQTTYDNYLRDEIYLGWQQEAYRTVANSMLSFQSTWFGNSMSSNLGYEAAWNNYMTSVTDQSGNDSNAIKINSTTETGSYEISVQQVAQSEKITSTGSITGSMTSSQTVSELESTIQDAGELNLNFSYNGTTQEIKLTADDLATYGSVEEAFNQKLASAFGTGNISVSTTDGNKLQFETSLGNSVSVSSGTNRDCTLETGNLTDLNSYNLEIEIDGETYTISADLSGAETDAEKLTLIQDALKSATNSLGDEVNLTSTASLSVSKDSDGNITLKNGSSTSNIVVKAGSTGVSSDTRVNTASSMSDFSLSGSASTSVAKTTLLTDAFGGSFDEAFSNITLDADGAMVLNFGGSDITINESDTIQTFINKVSSSGASVSVDFNQITGRFSIESTISGDGGSIDTSSMSSDTLSFLKDNLGIDIVAAQTDSDAYIASGGLYTQGQNAIITIDGITVERNSNDIEMNGLNFTVKAVTETPVTLNAETDEDAIFDKITQFVEDYNSLVAEIEALVDTARIKDSDGYIQPLTSDEKLGLSDTEIAYWEEQAKTGLLYNDSILSGFLSDLRSLVYQSVDIGGTSIALYEIGITTSSDWTTDKLVVDEDKLREAISTRGDDIAALFTTNGTGLADKIDDVLDKYVSASGLIRTKSGIANTASDTSNLMTTALAAIREKINTELDRLTAQEESLYTQFARMEQAISEQNSIMSTLTSSLG